MRTKTFAFISNIISIISLCAFIYVIISNTQYRNPLDMGNLAASTSLVLAQEKMDALTPNEVEVAPVSVIKSAMEIYDEMSIEEKEEALRNGSLIMQYSSLYTLSDERLSQSKGALYYNGHKETYYSEKVLPGQALNIPGRHVADDGTIRDEEGYICVASDPGYYPKGATLITSLGPAKVYDTGCSYGTIDIYVSW